MKIKQLKLHNFRGISDLTIDFDPDEPTVLMGINGVGKSSILECLSILLSWFTNPLRDNNGEGLPFKEQDITNGESETFSEIITLYACDSLSSSVNDQEIKWLLSGAKKLKENKISNNLHQIETLVSEIRQNREKNPTIPLPLIVYYPTNRAVLDIPLRVITRNRFETINIYDQSVKGIDFRLFFEWFREREDLENELRLEINPDYRDKQLEAVRIAITQIMAGFENLRIKRSPLRMVLEKQGKELIINQLSDGEKCLLAMIGDIARRLAMANSSEYPLLGKGIILIDEIELHLHPKWQRKIIPSLTKIFPNCQLIVTTHSPQIISHVDWAYLLAESSTGITLEKLRSYGKDSNRILETVMGVEERPLEIQNQIRKIFRLIEEDNLEEAKKIRHELNERMGQEDPQLLKADVLIKRKEILKG